MPASWRFLSLEYIVMYFEYVSISLCQVLYIQRNTGRDIANFLSCKTGRSLAIPLPKTEVISPSDPYPWAIMSDCTSPSSM